jgi:ATP adenylyltransferase
MTDNHDEAPISVDPHSLPGVPDGFQRLWTPHRIAYVEGETVPANGDCVFCVAPGMSDDDSLVVARGELVYAVLNLFPYNSGHLLICPYRHVANYDELTAEEIAEMGVFVQTAMRALRQVSAADGFNVGINQGKVAGAGIEAHVHQHVVPRWGQDSNFFPIIARTKAMPRLLGEMREMLRHGWPTASSS